MYEELSLECKERIDVEKKHSDSQKELLKLKEHLSRTTDNVTFTKWKMELLNFDLNDLLFNMKIQEWPEGIKKVFIKHFKEKIPEVKVK